MVEQRVSQPLVPLGVLRQRTIGWGNVAGLLAFATETSVVFLLTLYLQKVLGYTPLTAGLSFAVLGLGTVIGGIVGPSHRRVRQQRPCVAGFLRPGGGNPALIALGDVRRWIVAAAGARRSSAASGTCS